MYQNLPEMFDQTCRNNWWRKAVIAEDGTLRYYNLQRKTNKLAGALINKLNLKSQEKVAVLLNNSSVYPIVFFSILKSGSIVVPVNTFLKGEEVKYIINQSNARVIITSKSFYGIIKEIRPYLSGVSNIIFTDEVEENNKENISGYSSLDDLVKGYSEKSGKLIRRDIHPDSAAVIIYTSGTTGYPKGAMLTHKNLINNVNSCLLASRIKRRDRVILVLPMFHSFTMTVCMLMPIAAGGGMVIIKSLHQFKRVFRQMLFYGVTILVGIPPLYELLSKAGIPVFIRKLLRIRLCISGAAPLQASTLKRFEENWKIPLLEGYGLSEASPVVSLNPLDGERKAGSVGVAISGVQIKIAGPDESEMPIGREGEVIVRGDNVMKGYYNNPDATQTAIRGGWLFTGDIGKIDEDGYLYIVDRKKDMILVRGLNVYPREIEQVLDERPDVSEVSVIGKPDVNRGEIPVAFIIPKDGYSPDRAEIMRYCRDKLADYKVPRQVIIVDKFPRTPTGKILKRELKKMAAGS